MSKQIRVRGLDDCTGLWGQLNIGEEKDLDAGIAESLILGGLAEPVEPEAKPAPQDNARAAAEAAEILAKSLEEQLSTARSNAERVSIMAEWNAKYPGPEGDGVLKPISKEEILAGLDTQIAESGETTETTEPATGAAPSKRKKRAS